MKPSKQTLNIARLVHVYVSMALLTLLVFFSITGITLNHPEWFASSQPKLTEREFALKYPLPANAPLSSQQVKRITDEVEQKLGISLDNAESELMDDELYFGIKQAGLNRTVSIDLQTGEGFYESTDYGVWAWLNDLHKGRNTSQFWGWIIDLSSALFIVFAISGFILAMPQRRFRRTLLTSVITTLAVVFGMLYLT